MFFDMERLAALLEGVDRMCALVADSGYAMRSLGCAETDAVVEVMALSGNRGSAASALLVHAEGDDHDDDHRDLVRARLDGADPASMHLCALAEVEALMRAVGIEPDRARGIYGDPRPADLYVALTAIRHADGTLPGTEAVPIVEDWLARSGFHFPEPDDECDGTPDDTGASADTPHGK